MPARTFEDTEARRASVPLMIGLTGPSGGGKTFSALRLATGIQRVTGGDTYVVDTESRRALHYADRFKFRHVPFAAPFGPLDYLQAVEHCARRGAKVVVVDSMSHEHEGPGGVLEMHEAEMQRLGGERMTMLAWAKPKAERRRMINSILQLPVSAIFCFRAKEKLKVVRGKEPVPLGYCPIAGEEFVFEMTVNCLLLPKAGGVPAWQSDEIGERATMKLPAQFEALFADRAPLSEDIGEAMARWASGGAASSAPPSEGFTTLSTAIATAADVAQLEALADTLADVKAKRSVPAGEFRQLRAAYADRLAALKAAADAPPDFDEPGADG